MLRGASSRLAKQASQLAATGVRGLSAAAENNINLPPQFGIPGRYASALYMAAVKTNNLGKIEEELGQVSALMAESKDFASFVADPSVPRATKIDGLTSVLTQMGASDVTKNFVGLLADNNRLSELQKILGKFMELAADQRGEVKAVVITAEGLTKEQTDEIARGLKPMLMPGQTLSMEEEIDPRIIGGLILSIGDKYVDMSVLARVKRLQTIVRDAI